MSDIKLREIGYDELELMMVRLVLKVKDYPELFNDWEMGRITESVSDFIKGEDARRKLFIK